MFRRSLVPLGMVCLVGSSLPLSAQQPEVPSHTVQASFRASDGLTLQADSVFRANLRFFLQDRVGFTSVSGDDLSAQSVDMRMRRFEIGATGHVLDHHLRYLITFGLSRADLDLVSTSVAQPVLDAVAFWDASAHFTLGIGQWKVQSNREQIMNSSYLELPDRSLDNALFTEDRDVGLFGTFTWPVGPGRLLLKGSVTSGEGRAGLVGDDGLCYHGRVEWLPFGPFANKGDYTEGDLECEPRGRLSIASAFGRNERTTQTAGQTGPDLFQERSINTLYIDAVYKRQGLAISAEAYDRRTDGSPFTFAPLGDVRSVYVGTGLNVLVGRMVGRRNEVVARESVARPAKELGGAQLDRLELGVNHYFNGHRIKLQGAVGYTWTEGRMGPAHEGNTWMGLVQFQIGI